MVLLHQSGEYYITIPIPLTSRIYTIPRPIKRRFLTIPRPPQPSRRRMDRPKANSGTFHAIFPSAGHILARQIHRSQSTFVIFFHKSQSTFVHPPRIANRTNRPLLRYCPCGVWPLSWHKAYYLVRFSLGGIIAKQVVTCHLSAKSPSHDSTSPKSSSSVLAHIIAIHFLWSLVECRNGLLCNNGYFSCIPVGLKGQARPVLVEPHQMHLFAPCP